MSERLTNRQTEPVHLVYGLNAGQHFRNLGALPAAGLQIGDRVRYHRYRNRRIGEFLKELDLTKGRSTGMPKILKVMAANGSPAPLFESDDDRLSFVFRLSIHPLVRSASNTFSSSVAASAMSP